MARLSWQFRVLITPLKGFVNDYPFVWVLIHTTTLSILNTTQKEFNMFSCTMATENAWHRSSIAVLIAAVSAINPHWDDAAMADVVTANYVNDSLFNYRLDHMPDLDQKRAGLAGDGNYHCVPTSTMNLIMYAANHGFSDVQPGPGYWQAQQNYDTATGYIGTLGFYMQTSYDPGDPDAKPPIGPSGGTGGASATAGLQWYLDFQPDYFVVNHHLTAPDYTTNFANVAKSVIGGNIGTISYGRYDIIGQVNGMPMVQRDGGHATTIVRCIRNAHDNEIWVRDPADSGDSIDEQSQFTNRIIQTSNLTVVLMDNEDPPGPIDVRTMTALNYDPTSDRVALMDGHSTLRPKSGFSFSSSLTHVSLNTPNTFTGGNQPTHQDIPSPSGVIFDADYSAIQEAFLLIAGDPNQQQLYRFDPVLGSSQPVALPATPKLFLACANGKHVYIGGDGSIRLLSAGLQQIAQATLPTDSFSLNFGAIKFEYKPQTADDQQNAPRIVLASTPARKVLFYPTNLTTPVIRDMPTLIPGNLLDMAIEPATGRLWFCMDQGSKLYGVLWSDNGTPQVEIHDLGSTISFTGLEFSDSGEMHVCAQGKLMVLRRSTTGNWIIAADSPFHGLKCEGRFEMMHNSSNYDPAFHDHPAWSNNIAPDELDFGTVVPDCTADIVPDDVVNVDDLLAVINAWGACVDCPSDVTGDGTVDVDDLLAIINSWGDCF
jgi:hypothetical protein